MTLLSDCSKWDFQEKIFTKNWVAQALACFIGLPINHACRQLFKELLRVKPELMQEISAEAFYRTEIARVKVSTFYGSTPTLIEDRFS
ncbi:hypothetical protein CleRT_10010 [Candidatus Coxiella mudrowiae]|uniref:Uncharacterized protein n=1 Tax=Candidatus Coxiella mudrowiae TaxID=2054173 RepID=A0ABM5UUQ3_9COXI|nr:hypothetical protein CleRT_10010 [Candidatus Coxiella mudrowiae]